MTEASSNVVFLPGQPNMVATGQVVSAASLADGTILWIGFSQLTRKFERQISYHRISHDAIDKSSSQCGYE